MTSREKVSPTVSFCLWQPCWAVNCASRLPCSSTPLTVVMDTVSPASSYKGPTWYLLGPWPAHLHSFSHTANVALLHLMKIGKIPMPTIPVCHIESGSHSPSILTIHKSTSGFYRTPGIQPGTLSMKLLFTDPHLGLPVLQLLRILSR